MNSPASKTPNPWKNKGAHPTVQWYDIREPNDPELDRLAQQYNLHPLHIEDCRHREQRAKVEEGSDYIFIVLKPVEFDSEGELTDGDLDIFVGNDWVITVQETECKSLTDRLNYMQASVERHSLRSDQFFYRLMDGLVDTYPLVLDELNDQISVIEDRVLESPDPETLERIFAIKRNLIAFRRVLANTRDVASHLQRMETNLIGRDMWPFLRDLYDHLARNMDLAESQRDLLNGALDIYLSSVANRTNQVVKVLTVLGTIATPSIVVSGFYGMNVQHLPGAETPYGMWVAVGTMATITGVLLLILKRFNWL
jgi:magnesium transporter